MRNITFYFSSFCHTLICWFISAESAVQQNVLSSQSCCLWQQCWYHRPSSSVTHYNEHFTQILSPLFVAVFHSVSLFHLSRSLFFPPLFLSWTRMITMELVFHFCKSFFCNQLANKHCSPMLFHHFLFISISPSKDSFPPRQSHR